MKKAFYLVKLGPILGLRVIKLYLKRAFTKLNEDDFGVISYFNLLFNNKFSHVKEFDSFFLLKTKENVLLNIRKHPSSDFQVIRQIWTDNEYEIVCGLISKKISHGVLTIVDAGANVGYSSVFLNNMLKRDYQISLVAIEPSFENLEILKMNFKSNHITDYTIEHAGLYNKTCFLELERGFRDGKDWSIQVKEVLYETPLRTIEIKEVVKKMGWENISFFKMDIEGAERFLFSDKNYAADFLKLIKIIAIEIHNEYNCRDQIYSCLLANNFHLSEHGELVVGVNYTLMN